MGLAGSHSLMHTLQQGGRMTLLDARLTFHQVSSAIAYLHSEAVAHRDLKPENIMLSDGNGCAMLVDFGLACSLDDLLDDPCGSMPFVAPEVLRGDLYDGAPADMWSLGVVLLEMLCGAHSLSTMLGWKNRMEPEPARAKELTAYFHDNPSSFEAFVKSRIECGASSVPMELLTAALNTEPAKRCTAESAVRLAGAEWCAVCAR